MNETIEPQKKPCYTVPEFAALFGMERTWAYRLLQQGKLRAITGYGWTKIPHSEVERVANDASRYLGQKRKRREHSTQQGDDRS
jgi:hypothetical protein